MYLAALCNQMTGFFMTAGLILERKGMPTVFQKKGKKRAKSFENLGENVQNLKIF